MSGQSRSVVHLILRRYFHVAGSNSKLGGAFTSSHSSSLRCFHPIMSSVLVPSDSQVKLRLYSHQSAHEPANLDLRSSAGSQAAQAATIGSLTAAERSSQASVDSSQGNAGGSDARDISARHAEGTAAEDSNRHDGNLSLHSAMQSSVPDPYTSDNRSPNHMNMPAGGDLRRAKYASEQRQAPAMEEEKEACAKSGEDVGSGAATGVAGADKKASQKERMKKAVKEYGATVIVFHTSISLCTLGIAYAAVSSGVDVVGLLSKLGVGESILESKLATGTSTFVVAYAAHKVFAPLRMATTLTATPFIVHYLRRIGVLKTPPITTSKP